MGLLIPTCDEICSDSAAEEAGSEVIFGTIAAVSVYANVASTWRRAPMSRGSL